jgi:adenylate cyclase
MTTAAPAIEVLPGAVVFTDIVGFTEFNAVRGDAEALDLLAAQEAIVQRSLPDGARVVKELGDGLLMWFPEACAAIACALDMQDAFEQEAAESLRPLWVRIGMHWGRPTRRRDDIVGHDVNLCARIVDVAGPGEVILSGATIEAMSEPIDGVEFEELGPVVMKGIPDPVPLYRAFRF